METLDNKTNAELLFELKKLEAEHDALKQKMLKDFDYMTEIEKNHKQINTIISNRLKIN